MKKQYFLRLFIVLLVLSSCKKEKTDTGTASIQGTYKFKGATAHMNSTLIASDGEKEVSIMDYSTANNLGDIVFDQSSASSNGISYSINTLGTDLFYQDNELTDSITTPLSFTLPPTNSVATYQLIGKDSIYFSHGSIISGVETSGNVTYIPSGGHYSMDGNLLTLTENASRDSSYMLYGATITFRQTVELSMILEKQ